MRKKKKRWKCPRKKSRKNLGIKERENKRVRFEGVNGWNERRGHSSKRIKVGPTAEGGRKQGPGENTAET